MAFTSYDNFRSSFSAAKGASNGALDLAFGAAEDELVELVGTALVADAKLENPVLDSAAKIIRAHSFLSFATFLINNRAVKKEQSAESAGMGSNHVNNEYYSANELIALAEEWRKKALRAINDYLTPEAEAEEDGEGFFPFIGSITVDKKIGW